MSLHEQFGHPRGALGWVVGALMAVKNGKRSRIVLEALGAAPGERILEVGFGPGVDLARVEVAVGSGGAVAGVDVSREMVRQASRRNRAAIAAGRADLELGSIESLPFEAGVFDAAYSVNAAQFWPDLGRGMRELGRVVKPSGRVVIGVQPMKRGATERDSRSWMERLSAAGAGAGLGLKTAQLGETSPPVAIVTFEVVPGHAPG